MVKEGEQVETTFEVVNELAPETPGLPGEFKWIALPRGLQVIETYRGARTSESSRGEGWRKRVSMSECGSHRCLQNC
eukprot:5925573-Pyramimonas_sp.AAC.1